MMIFDVKKFLIAFDLYYITIFLFLLPCDHIKLTEVFRFSLLVLFSFLLKQQYLISQLKMTLEKLSQRSASIRSISLALIFKLNLNTGFNKVEFI